MARKAQLPWLEIHFMARETLGGVPFEVRKEGGLTKIRFFPKTEGARNPDKIVFVLSLDNSDKEQLRKILG